jgi:ketosteroid isomerase-like protein
MSNLVEEEILRLEEEMKQADLRVDMTALERFYADDILVVTPTGLRLDKSGVMAELHQLSKTIAAGQVELETYDKEEMLVRAFDETAAVVSYRLIFKGKYEGAGISQQLQITNFWLKRNGNWQIVSRHTTNH